MAETIGLNAEMPTTTMWNFVQNGAENVTTIGKNVVEYAQENSGKLLCGVAGGVLGFLGSKYLGSDKLPANIVSGVIGAFVASQAPEMIKDFSQGSKAYEQDKENGVALANRFEYILQNIVTPGQRHVCEKEIEIDSD